MTYYARRVDLFDGSSAQSSTYTSEWQMLADYERVTVSWLTDTAAGSRLTLQGSLDDGFSAAITNTSDVSGVVADGQFSVDPNLRWVRAQRSSDESLSIVQLQLRT